MADAASNYEFEDGYESIDSTKLDLGVGETAVFKFRQWDKWEVSEKDGTTKDVKVAILQDLDDQVCYHSGSYDLVKGLEALNIAPGRVLKVTRLEDKDTGAPSGMKCYRLQPAKI